MISLVMSYKNRLIQLKRTLDSIKTTCNNNYEIIIVDDGSDSNNRLENIAEEYNFKLIRLEPENKTWVNPCVTYNIGFKHAQGDKIIIQNPECYHVGDIINFVQRYCTDENYISFATFSIDKFLTENCFDVIKNMSVKELNEQITNSSNYEGEGKNCWYNHLQYAPKAFHFCASITRKNLDILNGFDEIYSQGIGFDDDDLVLRISRLPLKIHIPDDPMVIHQWHYNEHFKDHQSVEKLFNKNAEIFRQRLDFKI
jgi:glycosyltransferase involved in cell wall biosynthesis